MKFLSTLKKIGRIKNNSDKITKNKSDNSKKNKKFTTLIFAFFSGGSIFAILIGFIVVIAVLIFLGYINIDGALSNLKCSSLPSATSICKTITPEGYSQMTIDEYVAGVVSHEEGNLVDDDYQAYRAFAIAARSYILGSAALGYKTTVDDDGNCYVENSTSFQMYWEPKEGDELTKAVEDTSGMVLLNSDGSIYVSEYDAFCYTSVDSNYYYLCQGGDGEEHLKVPVSWANKYVGTAAINYDQNHSHGRGLSQNGAWYLAMERNWDYEKILNYFYGDEGVTIGTLNKSGKSCSSSSSGLTDLENYNYYHSGLSVLNKSLSSSEISDLNDYIDEEVDKAGYGTGDGVAAAGQALIYWLEQKGYFLGYYWGGGWPYRVDGYSVGASSYWGSTYYGTDSNNGNNRPYYGMDCGAFVAWATRTACKASYGNTGSNTWYNYGDSISLSDAKPGDVLVKYGSHIRLVIRNNGDGTVVAAESAGGSYSSNGGGLIFSHISAAGDYKVVDMSSWYANNCNSSR